MSVPRESVEPGAVEGERLLEVPIANLEPDPFQPRMEFNEAAIRELADSIQQHGILQPLLVRPMQGPNSRGRYWIVGGERRYRAAQLLKLSHLPCRVRPYQNVTAAVIALAENVHRADLNEIEKAEALQRIRTMTGKSWDEVSATVKLSRDYVKRLAGLLRLEAPVIEKVRSGEISARTAIALKPLPPLKQLEMAERVVKEGLTAEQVRAEARRHSVTATSRARPSDTPAPQAPEPRTGSVLQGLHQCSSAVRGVEDWLSARDWTPSKVPERQREALEALHQQVTLLQQYLLYLREPLREAMEREAEQLRSTHPLDF